jgi:hypothetical protein
MFSLTVLDHVRLDSEHVAQNYTIHARAADRLATAAFVSRVVMTILLAAATAAAAANFLIPARFYQVAAVVASVTATAGFALFTVFGFDTRAMAHRSFAHRLWIVCERYRSLISEASEGFIDRQTLLNRRDELIVEVHSIYERGFASDQKSYEAARLPALPAERAA